MIVLCFIIVQRKMAKVKYTVKENTKIGTHSFYASPVSNGTLTTEEVVEEACENTSIEPSLAKAVFTEVVKAVKRNVLKGFRVNLGDDFITVYPNIKCSVKDTSDTVATAAMVKASNADCVSRLGCTVNAKFSKQFASEVSWQKVDQTGAAVDDEDVTDSSDSDTSTGTDLEA